MEILLGDSEKLGLNSLEGKCGSGRTPQSPVPTANTCDLVQSRGEARLAAKHDVKTQLGLF